MSTGLAKQTCQTSQVDASWKLATCVFLWLCLASSCVHLRWPVMTCAHFGRDQICTQVSASFSPLDHPTQVNASRVASINLLLTNEIVFLKMLFVLRLARTCKETCRSIWATQPKSLCKFNLCPLATTCRSVWPGLKHMKTRAIDIWKFFQLTVT